MEGSTTLDSVKDLLDSRNRVPYFAAGKPCIKDSHTTDTELLQEMWRAGTLGLLHENWQTGNRDSFGIYAFDKPSIISMKGLDVGERIAGLDYLESDKDYITCPQLYFGPDTYTMVSSHKGMSGLLIRSVMKAMNHFAPKTWNRESASGDIRVGDKAFFSWIADGFGSRLSSYSLEITIFTAHKDETLFLNAYHDDYAYLADGVSGLLDLIPGLDLGEFFEYIYDNIWQFY